jgi:hypothetical protein
LFVEPSHLDADALPTKLQAATGEAHDLRERLFG